MTTMNGVIYVATGSDYVELARTSAASLRAVEPSLLIDLFTDDPDRSGLEMFDQPIDVLGAGTARDLDEFDAAAFEFALSLRPVTAVGKQSRLLASHDQSAH